MPFPSPSLTPPELSDFQWSFNSLTMGAGTPYGVLVAEGFDLADIRSGDINYPRDHGQVKGLDLHAGKDIILDIWLKTDGTSLQHAQLALAAATVVRPLEEIPLWFQLPNMPLLCVMCRPRKRPMKIDSDYAAAQIGKPELVLHATDPRIYQAGEESEALKPKPPGGSTVVLNNEGNTEMRPIVVFTGPCAGPTATNETITGKPYLQFLNPVKREEREAAELVTRTAAEKTEASERHVKEETFYTEKLEAWRAESEFRFGRFPSEFGERALGEEWEAEGRIAAAKTEAEERATREAEETTEREADEAEELTKLAKGEEPTVKEGDQLVVDLATPHLILYYVGGIEGKVPENAAGWLVPGSTWWDIIPSNNTVKFSSLDEAETAATCRVQWTSASEI